MDRQTIQDIFDNKFYDEGLRTYPMRESTSVKEDEYITFKLGNGRDSGYADNNPLVKEKYLYVYYYSTNINNLDKRNKEIVDLMRQNGFSVIDDGSDIPASTDADIWGIAMEFYYGTVI